jgi:hypothetical protein
LDKRRVLAVASVRGVYYIAEEECAMTYHVINKISGELKSLTHTEVNDVGYDNEGRVIVYGTDQEAYYLIVDEGMIED